MTKHKRAAALSAALLVLGLLSMTGCATRAQTGALAGAGLGALGGYIIGNEADKDDWDDHGHHHHGWHRGRGHW